VAWPPGCPAFPLLLHEQNAAAGLTNKLLARIARRVLMAFPGAFAPMPAPPWWATRRPEVVALLDPQLRSSDLRLLVVAACRAGSSTSRCLHAVAAAGVPIEVRHQCGKGNGEAVAASYAGLGSRPR
jgi:UDP-N-acetylglucosamine--N-acetylmuramyl-(pentapeptide) pyrophosphoryl-undecaprenol N-acetylglucosamine transferase